VYWEKVSDPELILHRYLFGTDNSQFGHDRNESCAARGLRAV
jgi:hypothetical protein